MFRVTRALPILIVAGTMATTACASSSAYSQRYPSGVRNVDDRAYDGGLRQGRERGADDARRGRAYDVRRHQEYRNADRNYGAYDATRAFRGGFETGYDQGYRRYASGGYGSPDARVSPYPARQDPYYGGARGRYASAAFDNGYRDGYEAGVSDARDRDPYDPIRQKRYREGDRGYDNDYGSRDTYKRDYRAAFQRGYEEGYRLNRR
jgi:hypothetical protein